MARATGKDGDGTCLPERWPPGSNVPLFFPLFQSLYYISERANYGEYWRHRLINPLRPKKCCGQCFCEAASLPCSYVPEECMRTKLMSTAHNYKISIRWDMSTAGDEGMDFMHAGSWAENHLDCATGLHVLK